MFSAGRLTTVDRQGTGMSHSVARLSAPTRRRRHRGPTRLLYASSEPTADLLDRILIINQQKAALALASYKINAQSGRCNARLAIANTGMVSISSHPQWVRGSDLPRREAWMMRRPWGQPVVAFDLDDSVGQDARRACDVDVG
jgi:hypothetical protein